MNIISRITRPSLIIDEQICRANIRRMKQKADASGVFFRPHFKTHQSELVGKWFMEEGIDRITVSSAAMAMQFAGAGWKDITIAFPANIRETEVFNSLAKSINLNLLLDSPEVAERLDREMNSRTGIFIEVDTGYGRSGLGAGQYRQMDAILDILKRSKKLAFNGFLTHDGNTYQASSPTEIRRIHQESIECLQALKDRYLPEFRNILISVGDTPACSIAENLSGADEIRPGNFVYYDLMQYRLGACKLSDIAVSIACPVCGIYPERNEAIVYAGAVHLSKEFLEEDGKYFGQVVRYDPDGSFQIIPGAQLVNLSQEHGTVRANKTFIEDLSHGDILGILPVHSCLTADLLKDQSMII